MVTSKLQLSWDAYPVPEENLDALLYWTEQAKGAGLRRFPVGEITRIYTRLSDL